MAILKELYQGGGESGGPTEADLRAAGYTFTGGGEGGEWQAPATKAVAKPSPPTAIDYLYDNYGTDKYLSALRSVESDSGPRTMVEGVPRFTLTPADPKSKKISVTAPTTEASNAPGYINPNAGRLLGYIYEDPESRTRSMAQQTPNDKQIPIYDSPFALTLNSKPLSAASRFAVGARVAGAMDAPVVDDENKSGAGIVSSHFFSGDVRKGLGLPNSFDMIRNMDPTKQDWGSMNWGLYNPKSSGFFGDMFQALGPLIRPLDALGLPPALQNAIKIGAAIATGGASTAAEAGSEIAGELAAQELAQQAAEQAIANAFAGTVAQGIGATAAGGLTGLLAEHGITGIGADMVKNAGMNAAIAAATGQDPFTAALKGAASAGVGGAVAESDLLEGASQNTINMAAGAAKAATGAALSGGNIFDAASQGALTGALSGSKEAGVKTFPVSGPESIPMTQLPTSEEGEFDQFLAGLDASAPTATEDWIDQAGLVEKPQTFEDIIQHLEDQHQAQLQAEAALSESQTPTEAAIDAGKLGGEEVAGQLKVGDQATPSEEWIDKGALVNASSTPTEDWIDQGGLLNKDSTATEDWIDQGGLGGVPASKSLSVADLAGLLSTGPTSTAAGAATSRQTQATQPLQMLQSLLSQPAATGSVSTPVQTGPLGLQTRETGGGFEGPLQSFLKQVSAGSYLGRPQAQQNEQQRTQTMPEVSYFKYGQPDEIDNILSPAMAEGGLATPLMAAGGGTRYGKFAKGGLNVVHHSGKMRTDFRQGDAVTGPGDGQSDDIPAMLADGEFVFPADVVAALGNGSTKAGSDKLYEMMHEIRNRARSAHPKDLPPPAKSPLDYLKGSRKARR